MNQKNPAINEFRQYLSIYRKVLSVSILFTNFMKYNKLVRDKIPEYIRNKGQKAVFHIANREEYRNKLKEKLMEETKEFLGGENIEEFADLLEVIDAIAKLKKFNRQKVSKVRADKARRRGLFKKRIILDES